MIGVVFLCFDEFDVETFHECEFVIYIVVRGSGTEPRLVAEVLNEVSHKLAYKGVFRQFLAQKSADYSKKVTSKWLNGK